MIRILSRFAFVFSLGVVGVETYMFITRDVIHASSTYRFQYEMEYIGALLLAWVLMLINFFYPYTRKKKRKAVKAPKRDKMMPAQDYMEYPQSAEYFQVPNRVEYSSDDITPILPNKHKV